MGHRHQAHQPTCHQLLHPSRHLIYLFLLAPPTVDPIQSHLWTRHLKNPTSNKLSWSPVLLESEALPSSPSCAPTASSSSSSSDSGLIVLSSSLNSTAGGVCLRLRCAFI